MNITDGIRVTSLAFVLETPFGSVTFELDKDAWMGLDGPAEMAAALARAAWPAEGADQ